MRGGSLKLPFVAALATSAFLLFTLELFAGREVLPVFGGAPGVWATALCFFSGMLFLGYGYAHLSVTRLGTKRGGLVHLVLAIVLVAVSTQAPTTVASLRIEGAPEALNVLWALLVIAGPPAFLLASTTPLLSAWFAGTSADAWWLYAASNAASLLGLLAYPFLIEPRLPLSVQRVALLTGLVVFVLLLAAIVALQSRASAGNGAATQGMAPREKGERLRRRRQLWWLIAAFIPAGLLTATTNFLTTDLVSAPLLWVGPLAIYLASFVVAFSERGRRLLPAIEMLVPAAATLLWLPYVVPVGWPVVPLVVIVLGSFAVLATAVHGRLAEDRPDSGHLTQFYLILSAAGVLATAIVGVIAPLLLSDIYEYPLLLLAGPAVLAILRPRYARWLPDLTRPVAVVVSLVLRLIPYVLVGVLLFVFTGRSAAGTFSLLAFGGIAVAIALTPRLLAITTPIALVTAFIALSGTPGSTLLFQGRSFFGVSKVVDAHEVNSLYSGTTLHGLQFVNEKRIQPTTYYVTTGPLGDVFDDLRARSAGAAIGVVGLGSGTIAVYGQPTDSLAYFEIDPLVVSLASDPRYFSYLHDSPAQTTVVEGDGRLSLDQWPSVSLDVLVLDAFSSDSVPPHLLTSEAIGTYMRTLKPGGVLAFNLSNRYYDLAVAMGATAQHLGLDALRREYLPTAEEIAQLEATGSIWVVVGATTDVDRFAVRGWVPIDAGGPILTDDYPDITRVLRWHP